MQSVPVYRLIATERTKFIANVQSMRYINFQENLLNRIRDKVKRALN
jgi:hypothetical protein